MLKNPFQLPPKTCPHCQQDFIYFDKKQEILFCPHCQNSLLAIPPIHIDNNKPILIQFFQFYLYGVKRHLFLWFFISSIMLVMYVDKEWLYFVVFSFWIIGFLLAIFYKKFRKYFDTLQYQHHHLKQGVDKIGDLSKEYSVEQTLQNLHSGAKLVCCPNCTSQRLKSLDYQIVDNGKTKIQHICLHCNQPLLFNAKSQKILFLYFVLIVVANVFFQHYFVENIFALLIFGVFCFTTSDILEFIDFKQDNQ